MKKAKLALVASAALVGVAMVSYVAVLLGVGRRPGWFHRDRLEAIVAEVRRRALPANEVVDLYLEDMSDPRSLRPWAEPPVAFGKGAGHVWTERTPEGRLKVVIETTDLGHAGEYGFAFSDLPLAPVPGTQYPEVCVPGRLIFVEGPESQIDEHWWRVYTDN